MLQPLLEQRSQFQVQACNDVCMLRTEVWSQLPPANALCPPSRGHLSASLCTRRCGGLLLPFLLVTYNSVNRCTKPILTYCRQVNVSDSELCCFQQVPADMFINSDTGHHRPRIRGEEIETCGQASEECSCRSRRVGRQVPVRCCVLRVSPGLQFLLSDRSGISIRT